MYTRIFTGEVVNVQPTGRTAYSIVSAEKLVELLTSMQVDASMQPEHLSLIRETPATDISPSPTGGTEVDTLLGEDTATLRPSGDTQGASPAATSAHAPPPAASTEADADGYTVHRSKGARKAATVTRAPSQEKPARRGSPPTRSSPKPKPSPTIKGTTADVDMPKEQERPQTGSESKPKKTEKVSPPHTGSKPASSDSSNKRKGKKTKNRFDDFQRAEAKGYYDSLLAPSDSDDDDMGAETEAVCNVQEDDVERVEALVGVTDLSTGPTLDAGGAPGVLGGHVERPLVVARKASDPKRGGQTGVNLSIKQRSMGIMADKTEKLLNSATATKATRRQQIEANRTGLGELRALAEEKAGLVQMSMAQYMHTCDAEHQDRHTDGASLIPSTEAVNTGAEVAAEYVPATPDSQDEFTMGVTHTGTEAGDADNPIQTGLWLRSFNGHEVQVAANGHCAFLALYASTKNHDQGTLDSSSSTVKQTTKMKSAIYACMMANLRHDVALGLVDPLAEMQRIFPHQARHTSVAAATAGLFAHYAQARGRVVDKWQPVAYWAGPHELRAMAQFLREPLLVLDARASTDAHIQRYLYKDYRLDDGSDHESGYVEALSDRDAADYLRSCFALHVIPIFLVLKRQESHFYGVGHGELWTKWQAEGDPAYTASLPDTYEWKTLISQLSAAEADTDLARLNVLDDSPAINSLIVKRIPTRDRLDIVHARRGIPTLDQAVLVDDIEDLLTTEESILHAAYGADGYAADLTQSDGEEVPVQTFPARYSRSATGPAVTLAYKRILADSEHSHLGSSDSPLFELMQAENREAFMRWSNVFRDHLGIPATRKRKAQIDELQDWLLDNYVPPVPGIGGETLAD